jgi:hypothetical protein
MTQLFLVGVMLAAFIAAGPDLVRLVNALIALVLVGGVIGLAWKALDYLMRR